MYLFNCNRRKVIVGIQTWCDPALLWWDEDCSFKSREGGWIKMWDESLGWISPLQMGGNCCIIEITFKRDLQGLIRCFVSFLQERRLYLLVRSTSGWRNAMTFLFWEETGSTLLLSGKNCGWRHQTWWPNNATVVLSNLIFIFLHSN